MREPSAACIHQRDARVRADPGPRRITISTTPAAAARRRSLNATRAPPPEHDAGASLAPGRGATPEPSRPGVPPAREESNRNGRLMRGDKVNAVRAPARCPRPHRRASWEIQKGAMAPTPSQRRDSVLAAPELSPDGRCTPARAHGTIVESRPRRRGRQGLTRGAATSWRSAEIGGEPRRAPQPGGRDNERRQREGREGHDGVARRAQATNGRVSRPTQLIPLAASLRKRSCAANA